MKIFDCFMFFDEEMILDLRLNILDQYVDFFVVVESRYLHNGKKRELIFDINKYEKFKNKIIYLVFDEIPSKIEVINDDDDEGQKSRKYIMNAIYRENGQRNYILNGLSNATDDDMIIISDLDEIPNLENINFEKIRNKIILFQQDMIYYRFNLRMPKFKWTGTKACKKKHLTTPQWLRVIKDRKYSFFRLDIFFSKNKFIDVKIIKDGGWHFSNMKSAKDLEHKYKSYMHHREFDILPLSVNQIDDLVKNKKAIYDVKIDKRENKIGNGTILEKFKIKELPDYIQNNLDIYKEWID